MILKAILLVLCIYTCTAASTVELEEIKTGEDSTENASDAVIVNEDEDTPACDAALRDLYQDVERGLRANGTGLSFLRDICLFYAF